MHTRIRVNTLCMKLRNSTKFPFENSIQRRIETRRKTHQRLAVRHRWRFGSIMVTLVPRSCVARQEPHIPGALSILQGTVPGQVRGLGHMVPTYFRRELRDRALQRPSRLRTFSFAAELFPSIHPTPRVIPRHPVRPSAGRMTGSSGVSSKPRLRGSNAIALEYWITCWSLSSGGAKRRPGGG
jgi:hypothetical protein